MRQLIQTRYHGATAVLAMLFLVLITTLSVAMYSLATTNVQTAHNLSSVSRAQAAAEAGIRWAAYRFVHMSRPMTTIGNITPAVAEALWEGSTGLQQRIVDDLATMTYTGEQACTTTATSVLSSPISTEESGGTFQLNIVQDPSDARYLTVTSTGRYKGTSRSVSMRFKIDKKIRFAVVGKVPIQLGRNTIVEGPVAMATANKYPPLLMLSDFMHFDTSLSNKLTNWNTFLQSNHNGYDNRISVNNPVEYAAATAAGYSDYNGDAYIDEYDFFVQGYDDNGDKAISMTEFTNPSTGQLYDANLFKAIDTINGPMFSGDPERQGYNDGVIDNTDGYAKLRGYIELATTANAWQNWINTNAPGKDINDYIQGTVAPTEPGQVPVEFGVPPEQMVDLNPANFEEAAANFKTKTGPAAGTTVNNATQKHNLVLTAAMANGTTVNEKTPYGSTAYQATYRRPVFENINFKNVQIPKGLNALFKNCTFEGVTWVEGEHDITTSSGAVTYDKNEGMNWAQRRISGDSTFSKDKILVASGTPTSGQMKTRGSQNGNNLRFDGCTFNGPVAGNYATAYTHFANSWEFTGATMFNNVADETATILSPQVNIEMGSFTNPANAPSTLIGVVVAGNLDIRGTSNVDGSIIITGDGAGNTTLAYFGASDASTDPNAPMPEGGWGRLNIRYNPNRALPDGINLAIDVLPVSGSYSEGIAWPG